MGRSKLSFALIVSAAVFGAAAPDVAADPPPRAEFGILYSVHHNIPGTFPIGWVFAAAGNITNWMAIVGEVGGNYKSMTEMGTDVTFREHAVLGGVRFAMRGRGPVVPFVHVLSGLGNIGVGAEGVSMSFNAFALQAGGGADIRMSNRTAIRIQGDYRLLRKYGENVNESRFGVGVVFRAGKR